MTEKQFDAIGYFKQLTEENNTCRLHNFVATTCSGPDTVQGVLQQFRTASNFVMVSDTDDSTLWAMASSTATCSRSGFSLHTSVMTWQTGRRN